MHVADTKIQKYKKSQYGSSCLPLNFRKRTLEYKPENMINGSLKQLLAIEYL